ncbi:MAG: AMP-binding protein [Zoogloeaceae bacterium]|nr:AMP-binding protein [Zoogloeaceae bacterium]MCK6383313.1 AMP-binding protein [Rhodocyclaceae bacterium]
MSSPAEDPAARLLRVTEGLVRETHPGRQAPVTLDSPLERDLGLDSLARVELLLRLGREFGQPLPEAALAEAETPRALLRFLGHAAPAAAPQIEVALPHGAVLPVPDDAATLIEVLEWHAAHTPSRIHVLLYEDGERAAPISYADLLAAARRIATGLVSRGLQPQQAVALMLPTGRDYLATFFGILIAGGIPVPIYPPARLAQIEDHLRRHARILDNAQAVFIVTVPQAKGVAALLRDHVPSLAEIVTPQETDAEPEPLLHRAAPQDIAFLQYTSGSTGDPKGVVLTHANLLANLRAMGPAFQVTSEDVFVSWLPLYHDMGLIGAWFGSLYFAMPLVLMSPLAFLARPARWLQAISRHRGTLTAAPNFAYELCARKLADAELAGIELRSLRLALNGAEPVSPATLEAFIQRFVPHGLQPEAITPVYGLAECSVGLAFPPLGRGPRIDAIRRETLVREARAEPADEGGPDVMRVPACGRALPGHEIRIVGEAGDELPDRRVGRLQFRGPSATRGYFRNPEATARLFRDGWLDSGDYAYLVEGEVYLAGRVKDLIIRGGRNLYPYELEEAVGEIPGIRKGCVAVFASTDPANATERLVVMAETRERNEIARHALRQKINDAALDAIGMPADEIVLAPPHSVLKTSSGKIRRAASREAFERGEVGKALAPAWLRQVRLGLAAAKVSLRGTAKRAGRRLYAAWCWALFALIAAPVALTLAALQRPLLGRRIGRWAARLFLLLTAMPVRTRGLERLPRGPHLLLANHTSYFDTVVLYAALPPHYAFVAKRELVRQPLLHAMLRGLGTLFVERYEAAKSAEDVEAALAALADGQSLAIFPEGTFSREAGLKPFRMGAFVAAARAGVPVAVAGLRGIRAILRDKTWLPRHGRPELEVGAVLQADGTDWAAAVRLREAARAEMLRLSGEHDLGGYLPELPPR